MNPRCGQPHPGLEDSLRLAVHSVVIHDGGYLGVRRDRLYVSSGAGTGVGNQAPEFPPVLGHELKLLMVGRQFVPP